jgi:hypothetical protein
MIKSEMVVLTSREKTDIAVSWCKLLLKRL